MTQKDKELCRQHMTPVFLEKDDYLNRSGEVPRYHYFIVSGHVRKYVLNNAYEETTIDLNDGPRWMSAYEYFYNCTTSDQSVQCITDCHLLRVSRDAFQILSEQGDTITEYGLLLFQKIMAEEKQRLIDMSILSAEERYLKLIDTHPNIVKHVPLKYVASYIGIQPGSLSRIRKEVSAPTL